MQADRNADAEPLLVAAARGVPLELLDLDARQARKLYDHPLVLVRPDQDAGWRGDAPPADPDGGDRPAAGSRMTLSADTRDVTAELFLNVAGSGGHSWRSR